MFDEEIKKQAKDKELKYKYQTNESRLISQLKDEMILCLLIEDPMKRSEVMERIIQEADRNKSPIRSERSFDQKDAEKRRRSIRRYCKKVFKKKLFETEWIWGGGKTIHFLKCMKPN